MRHREDRAGTGPDDVRVGEVRARRGGDDRVDPGPVGAAQDGPDVAGLLDALDDDDQRLGRERAGRRDRAPGSGRPRRAPRPDRRRPASRTPARVVVGRDRRAARSASSAARASWPASSGSQTNASTTSTPASSARRSSRAPSTRVRPVASRSRRSRSAAAALIRGFAGLVSGGSRHRGHDAPSQRAKAPSARRRAGRPSRDAGRRPRCATRTGAPAHRPADGSARRSGAEMLGVRGQQHEAVGGEERAAVIEQRARSVSSRHARPRAPWP